MLYKHLQVFLNNDFHNSSKYRTERFNSLCCLKAAAPMSCSLPMDKLCPSGCFVGSKAHMWLWRAQSSPAWITTNLVLTAASRMLALVSVGPCTYSNACSSGSCVKDLGDSHYF